MTITEAAAALRKSELSSVELTEACLRAAEVGQTITSAYVTIDREGALAGAREADGRRKAGQPLSELDGIPLAVKDNICVAGGRTTAGSGILKDYRAAYDATVVGKLRRSGAVLLGKTNMDEFAMGSSTESSVHGPTRNPWDTAQIPGGSSGGSAVAVAEGSACGALGSDTGGSIRQPAAMCGVVGLKPTYGRVSRYGLIAMASSLDQIGPLTRSVDDAELLLGAIEGRDANDSTSVELRSDWGLKGERLASLKGIRVGVPKEYFGQGMQPEVEASVRQAIERMAGLGAEIKEVSLPHSEYALAVYYVLMPSEVSANLARFDGMRYGTRVSGGSLENTYRRSRGQGFGKEARRRIMIGTYALSSGYYDAYYLQAQKARRLISDDFFRAFRDVDVLVGPTSPLAAWKLGEMQDDPLAMYLADIYTVAVNVAGLPALSLPCGLAAGLPVGFQFIGRHFEEGRLLAVARAFEEAHGRLPLKK